MTLSSIGNLLKWYVFDHATQYVMRCQIALWKICLKIQQPRKEPIGYSHLSTKDNGRKNLGLCMSNFRKKILRNKH